MDELSGVGVLFLVATLALLFGCGDAGAELAELDEEPATLELEQAAPVDCRPVRVPQCSHPWNDRACFHVPPECAVRAAPAPAE
jgi:hypothetical protein